MIKNFLLFLLFSVSAGTSRVAFGVFDPIIKGRVTIEEGYYRLIPEGSTKKFNLIITDELVQSRIRCLKEGDFISGNALSANESQIQLHSIDYVGLTALFGTWRNESEIFRFDDFQNFQYWNFNKAKEHYRGPFAYHYALSPAGEELGLCSWKIFILDSVGVTLGTLEWAADDEIFLQVYDSETGEVTSSKRLIRGVL
ncbi:MAG: hypothetical protein RJB66_1569 [Pseudomonadota bacterium]|jgi:hypothetical protein